MVRNLQKERDFESVRKTSFRATDLIDDAVPKDPADDVDINV